MKKLLNGIVDFRRKVLPGYREHFARLALGQSPDSLFVACSDSRVVPNLFASSDPGDLFVLRNVGNLIPPCSSDGVAASDRSAAAAIEFAVDTLVVTDLIICGHSECGAMRAILEGSVSSPNLQHWLKHGEPARRKLLAGQRVSVGQQPHNQLSQLNVLQQMEHLVSYPSVQRRLHDGTLRIHGWWFDIASAEVLVYFPDRHRFVPLDDEAAALLLEGRE